MTIPPSIIKKELKELIAAQADFVLLDVRTPTETREGKIKGAQEIDFHAADYKARIQALPKNKRYIVYCETGGRSGRTVSYMLHNGFLNVQNLAGGYSAFMKT